jgi:hypothetical protein
MRLGQLSRKLGLKPSDIHDFLKQKNPAVEANPNTRLTDEQVLLAIRHFDPSLETAIMKEESEVDTREDVNPPTETVPEVEQSNEQIAIESTETAPDSQVETAPEVIRVQKQELPGLRVVGKIELKEPKKKEAPPSAEESPEPAPQGEQPKPQRPSRPIRRDQPQRTWKNPLEAQRQREAEERREKRQQEIQREKEKRTQQYLKKVKSAPTKAVRKQEETIVETEVETRPAPKTWLGKIARWLTT